MKLYHDLKSLTADGIPNTSEITISNHDPKPTKDPPPQL